MPLSLTNAQLKLTASGPVSTAFDDIYFSNSDGIGESRYHFIDGNQLPQRFLECTPTLFTVAESGFGTGLNFLLTAQLWQKTAPAARQLHYISVEKYPISKPLLAQIYQQQQWQSPLSAQLLHDYPPPNVGEYQLKITKNIQLTLLFGDALARFSAYDFTADAWFLDGFAPAKNPDMWTQELFDCMAAHSHDSTTFATFTAASAVRRGLQRAGFKVNKGKGFGHKRERLLGIFNDSIDLSTS